MAEQQLNVSVDKNEITRTGRIIGGFLLIGFTLLPIIMLIGLWPNQMPDENTSTYYNPRLFAMEVYPKNEVGASKIHINTILFLLVALAGFMGSMVHLATSFTNYVGSGRFKKDWTLWYCVKPFTAAGVSVIFYMVLNAGLLNFSSSGSVNPYGIVILAALAGLFTDKATLKLEEIFTIIFKPKDERPDRLDEKAVKISGLDPKKLHVDSENNITITGENLDQGKLAVKINGEDIQNLQIRKDAISFSYKIDEKLATEKKLAISVFDGVKLLHSGEFELDKLAADDDADEEEEEPVDVDELIKG